MYSSQFFNEIRAFRRQVVHLSAICVHIVQLPRLLPLGDQLPFAGADAAIALMHEEDRILAGNLLTGECRHEAGSCHRDSFLASYFRGIFSSRRLEYRGHNVDKVSRLIVELAVAIFCDSGWPVSDERS
jgi:hypothetical protein